MSRFSVKTSIKHLQIDKANSVVIIAAAATTAIVVFSLVAAQSLYKQMAYQNKVINLRNKAKNQLQTNIKTVDSLQKSFTNFEDSTESVIGTADKNSKIVLDALPSKYDFPALATSLDGIIKQSGVSVTSITGTDNEASAAQDSPNPKPVEIPFTTVSSGSFLATQKLIANIEASIRPFKIKQISYKGSDSSMTVTINGNTYYQPEKKLVVEQKVISNGSKTVKKTTVKKATTK